MPVLLMMVITNLEQNLQNGILDTCGLPRPEAVTISPKGMYEVKKIKSCSRHSTGAPVRA